VLAGHLRGSPAVQIHIDSFNSPPLQQENQLAVQGVFQAISICQGIFQGSWVQPGGLVLLCSLFVDTAKMLPPIAESDASRPIMGHSPDSLEIQEDENIRKQQRTPLRTSQSLRSSLSKKNSTKPRPSIRRGITWDTTTIPEEKGSDDEGEEWDPSASSSSNGGRTSEVQSMASSASSRLRRQARLVETFLAGTQTIELPELRTTRFSRAARSPAGGLSPQATRPLGVEKRNIVSKFGFRNCLSVLVYFGTLGAIFGYLAHFMHADLDWGRNMMQEPNHTTTREQQQDIKNIRTNSQGDFRALMVNIFVGLCLVPCILWGFVLLRQRYPRLFDGRVRGEARTSTGSRRMSFKIAYTDFQARFVDPQADKVIQTAGLDGWMQLRFYTLNCRFLTTAGWLVMAVLCPLHVIFGNAIEKGDALNAFGIDNLSRGSPLFWVHAILVWVVTAIMCYMILRAQRRFLMYRYGWLAALPEPRCNTLIVENIPQEYRTDEQLKVFFEGIFPQSVDHASVVKRVPELRKKLKDMEAAECMAKVAERKHQAAQLSQTEEEGDEEGRQQASRGARVAKSKMEGVCMRCFRVSRVMGGSFTLDQEVSKYREKADTLREDFLRCKRLHLEGLQNGNTNFTSCLSRTGFVTFKSRLCASLALERRYRADAEEMVVSVPPAAKDVHWPDLAMSRSGSRTRHALGILSLIAIFLTWVPIIIALGGLATLSKLQALSPALANWLTKYSWGQSLLEGSVATLLLRLLTAIMPNILYQIIRMFFLVKAGTWAQLRLMDWYFSFQVIFVVMASALSRSLFMSVVALLDDPAKVLQGIEGKLPSASNFYLSYTVMGTVGALVYLLRPIAVMKYTAFRAVLDQDASIKRAQDEHPAFFGTGVRMTKATTMITVVLVYGFCQPIICFFALGYFCVCRQVYDFLLVNAEDKKPDLGGEFWVKALDQTFFGLFLFITVMSLILNNRAAEYDDGERSISGRGPALFCASSLAFLYMMWVRFKALEWRSLPIEKVVSLEACGMVPGRADDYIQPEFDDGAGRNP